MIRLLNQIAQRELWCSARYTKMTARTFFFEKRDDSQGPAEGDFGADTRIYASFG